MNLKRTLIAGAGVGFLLSGLAGCVTVNTKVGQDLMPIEQQYKVYTAEFDLENIDMKALEQMSAYSSRRITVGSLMDAQFGLTLKGSAFTLIPCVDTMDLGKDPVVREFHISMNRDTVNVVDENQANILQEINVYDFEECGLKISDIAYLDDVNNSMFAGKERITEGRPVYDGGDSIGFNFKKSFGEKYLSKLLELADDDNVFIVDSIDTYIKNFQGIYMCMDEQPVPGGRINMFELPLAVEDSYIAGNYAELKFTSTYDGERRDTSLLFLFGAVSVPESSSNLPDQYAYNCTEIKGGLSEASATDKIYIEGGNGIKPVVSAKEIREKMLSAIHNSELVKDKGIPDSLIIINKASIIMPYEFPGNYKYMSAYPSILTPVYRVKGYDEDGGVFYTYANLSDASISDESHGTVDRSNCQYVSDISFHAQKILGLKSPADTTLNNYDIWMLVTFTEITEESSSSSSNNDYLSQLYYYNYLNQLYGGYGGYGGYGYGGYGYGGYGYGGYGYSNYYSALMYSSLYGSSGSSTTSSDELDRDRFYGATLYGPTSTVKKPKLTLTFAVPKEPMGVFK